MRQRGLRMWHRRRTVPCVELCVEPFIESFVESFIERAICEGGMGEHVGA